MTRHRHHLPHRQAHHLNQVTAWMVLKHRLQQQTTRHETANDRDDTANQGQESRRPIDEVRTREVVSFSWDDMAWMFVIRHHKKLLFRNAPANTVSSKEKAAMDGGGARLIVLALRDPYLKTQRRLLSLSGMQPTMSVYSSGAQQHLGKWPCHLLTRHWRTTPCGCQRQT